MRLIRRQRGQVLARHRTLVLAEQPRDRAEVPLRVDGGSRGNGGEVGHPARIVVVLRIVDNLLKRATSKHAQVGAGGRRGHCSVGLRACNVLHFCAALNLSFLAFFFRFFRFGASTAISATGAALPLGVWVGGAIQAGWLAHRRRYSRDDSRCRCRRPWAYLRPSCPPPTQQASCAGSQPGWQRQRPLPWRWWSARGLPRMQHGAQGWLTALRQRGIGVLGAYSSACAPLPRSTWRRRGRARLFSACRLARGGSRGAGGRARSGRTRGSAIGCLIKACE